MSSLAVLILCAVVGLAAAPFGLLPSILLFTDVAQGTDTSAARKRLYGWVVWLGIGAAWALGTAVLAVLIWQIV